jgi:hypothetical protein
MVETLHIRRFFWGFVFIIAAGLLLSGNSFAQSTLVTLEGMILDPEGNPLLGTAITVRCVDTGYEYHCVSRPNGRYVVSGIQPGKYEVRAELPGFAIQTKSGLVFNTGASLKVDFQLSVRAIAVEVSVTAAAPMVEVAKSEVSSIVDRREIDDLPLLDRDFTSLSYTKPGVQEQGRSNAQPLGSEEMLVDGVSNEWTGRNTVRSQLPADAIEEFRVITNQYEAEFGNASGMIRTAVTRSGSNELRGRVSFFSRDEAFDSVNYFVTHKEYRGPELPRDEWQKPPYEHYRFGGFLGGPIKRDKAHFFLAYDGLRLTEYASITSPLVPKESVGVGTRDDLVLLKFSFQPGARNQLSLRFSLMRLKQTNLGVGGLYTKERAYDADRNCPEFQVNWTFFPSAHSINELRLFYSRTINDVSVHLPGTYSIIRPSGYFGKPSSLPQKTRERRFQVVDNFSFFLGDHSLKIGLDFSNIPSDGYVVYNLPGTFLFTTDKPFDPADFSTYPLGLFYNSSGDTGFDFSYREMGLFAQDSWRIHPRLTLNLGLRWNYFFCEHVDINHSDIRNLNPRLGLSWDPFGDGRTAIRAGVGTFSQNPQNNLSGLNYSLNKMDLRTVYYPNYPDPSKPNPFVPAIPLSVPPDKYASGKDIVPPFTVQTTLGFERQLFTDFSAAIDFVWSRGQHFTRGENKNPVIPGTGTVRPDPTRGSLWVMADHGKSDYRALYLVLNKRFSHSWTLEVSYTLSRSWSDVETEQTGPGSYEDNAWERQYGPTNFDALHKLAVTGIVDLPWGFQLSGLLFYRSALPWTAFYATDVNKDSLAPDMVDWRRNSRRALDYLQLNTRLSYRLRIHRFVFQVFAEGYNVTNRTNFTTIYSTYGSPLFGKPTAADVPRLIQLGARVDF